jgi:hypothetical protein
MPDDDGPILDYASPDVAPKRALWRRVVRALMAVLTLVVCFIAWFAAMDARSFVEGWKRYGNDPALLPQLEAAAAGNTRVAAAVFAVAIAGWGADFALRRRFRRATSDASARA